MAKIIAPNKEYNGVTATVQFIKGVGETENKRLIEWFRKHSYEVAEVKKIVDPDGDETPNLDKMKNDELIAFAKDNFDVEIKGNKNELLAQVEKLLEEKKNNDPDGDENGED